MTWEPFLDENLKKYIPDSSSTGHWKFISPDEKSIKSW